MKKSILVFIFLCSLISGFVGYKFFYKSSGLKFETFNLNTDFKAVDDLFHKGDNWYWMLANEMMSDYSLDHTLRYRSSSQYEKRFDLIIKVLKVNDKIVSFLAYYPKSAHIWHLLFLIVDQDFRRSGYARKSLEYAVNDMVSRGALKVDLATRNNNLRAQNLYESFGFKLVDSDDQFFFYSWNKV